MGLGIRAERRFRERAVQYECVNAFVCEREWNSVPQRVMPMAQTVFISVRDCAARL